MSRPCSFGSYSQDERVEFVNLSRNFGPQIAITAGLDYSSRQAVVVMDADLQDPPEVIPRLIQKWREWCDIVFAGREKRKGESLFKRVRTALFYRLLRQLTVTKIRLDAGDFRLISRRAVEALKAIRESNQYVRGLVTWVGFQQTSVTFVRDIRHAGESKYPLRKLVTSALNGINSFSFVPLRLATYLGLAGFFISFLSSVNAVGLTIFTSSFGPGWGLVIVAILFIGSLQLIILGIIGEYIGRIYEEVKQRPLYLVEEVAGFDKTSDGK